MAKQSPLSTTVPIALLLAVSSAALGQGKDSEARMLVGHRGSVMAVSFSPDGRLLASCSRDKTIRLWNVQTGKLKRILAEHSADVYSVEFSRDGRLLLSGSGDKTVRLWDARTGKVLRILGGHDDGVRAATFAPD